MKNPLPAMRASRLALSVFLLWPAFTLRAELKLPAVFSDHMVLQQKQPDPVWGWDTPGTRVIVSFAGQSHITTAGSDGKWTVQLDPLPANSTPQALTIAGTSTRTIQDVLVGEVWICSGQSNMLYGLSLDWNADLAAAAAHLPQLRQIMVPRLGTQEPQTDFKGEWIAATPETARHFTAVGFYFGRYLQQILGVPVGLITVAWGGASAEAFIRRAALENDPRFAALMARAVRRETEGPSPRQRADYEQAMAQWQTDSARAAAEGRRRPREPMSPETWLTWNARPGNIFNGMLHPVLGYGIKGVIWYQGENNADRAAEYRDLFPFLIGQWRKDWGQGDFPFYWVQLADFRAEQPAPGESAWAELREAQTLALKLPHTGQAVIIDLGEGRNIHPRHKHDVAARLVRWALANNYGLKLPYRSPEFRSLTIAGNKALVTLDCFGSTLRPFDVAEARGFAICGADRIWHWAEGRILNGEQVEVWNDAVPAPVAVRYAWADNPVCNLYSNDGLPVTPFRTDDFPQFTQPIAANTPVTP